MISKSLVGTVLHVWSQDGALDKSDPEQFGVAWAEFAKAGDVSKLPMRDGCRPSVFVLAPLTRKQFLRAYQHSGIEQVNDIVAYGLREVRDVEVDGRPLELEREKSEVGQRATAATLDALFDPLLFGELSARILEISCIDPTRGQG